MANEHGGYRDPGPVKGPSGPGKFSQRTDGMKKFRKDQAIRTPSLLGSPDIQSGDVQTLRQGQHVQPLPNAQAQDNSAASGMSSGTPNLPSWLFDQPTNRPGEPMSTGLATGAGPGPEALQSQPAAPDVREQVLQYIVSSFGNSDAAQMLQSMRMQRAQTQAPPPQAPSQVPPQEPSQQGPPAPPQGEPPPMAPPQQPSQQQPS